MEKIRFAMADGEEAAEFFVLEQTTIRGINYLLVTDSEEDEAEAWILKEVQDEIEKEADTEGKAGLSDQAVYEIVDDDAEMEAVSKVFMAMMDDTEIQL